MLVQEAPKPILNRISDSFKDFKTYDRLLKLVLCINKIAKNIFYSLNWDSLGKACKAFGHTFKNVKGALDLVRFTNNFSGLTKDSKTKAELVNMKIAASGFSLVSDLFKSAYSLGDLGLYALNEVVANGLGTVMGVATITSSGIGIGSALYNINLDAEVKAKWQDMKSQALVNFNAYQEQLKVKEALVEEIQKLTDRSQVLQAKIDHFQTDPFGKGDDIFITLQMDQIDLKEKKAAKDAELLAVDEELKNLKLLGVPAQYAIETADYHLDKLSEQYLDDVLTIISKVLNIATVVFNFVIFVFLPGAVLFSIALAGLGACSAGIGLYGVWKSTEGEKPLPHHPKFTEVKDELETYFRDKGYNFNIELQVLASI